MKKLLAITAAVAVLAMAGTAMAEGTANLSVQATITASCSVTAGSLSFGELDPFNPTTRTASSTGVTVRCATGEHPTLTADNGSHAGLGTQKFLSNGTDTIAYSITIPSLGVADASWQTVTIGGTIADTAYGSSKSAGTYSDTVVLTVAP
jgi:spore coat protein U-like protein